ncbi:tetratricopeptide repeat protein [Chitinophaga lutea]
MFRYLPVLLLLALFSCKSGEKLYHKGKYDQAVQAFVKKLQRRPADATSLQMLPQAYQAAMEHHEGRAKQALQTNDDLKWEAVRTEYRAMQALYTAIRSSPAALSVVKPKDYAAAILGAQENASEARYQRGLQLLEQGDKQSAREAYGEFDAALSLTPNYKDARQLRDEAYNIGLVKVVVSEIDVRSSYFQFSADQFRDALVRNLQDRRINTFVRFFDERSVRGERDFRPDQYMEMRFMDFVVGQTYVDRNQYDVSKVISVPGNKKDSTGKTVMVDITVRATVFLTRKTVQSSGILDYRITDVNDNRTLRQDRVPGSYTWQNQFGTFRGDERALSDEDRRRMGGRDIPPPPPQDLFLELTRPIYDRLASDLQSFYSRY